MDYTGWCYGIYVMAVKPELAFGVLYLTILYISFTILFCQKKVKKNCKSVARVFLKRADIVCEATHGKHAPHRS